MVIDNSAILTDLDPDQIAVVSAIRGPVCVIAGAGTGKTRVITNRIAYAINAGVTDPTKVLALTFTAKAAGEMRSRLRTLGISNAAARTFHSAALKQLLYFWPYAFGGQFPTLLTTKSGFISQAISRAEVAMPASVNALREIAGEIEWAKVLEISPDNYQQEAIASSRSVRLPNNKSEDENLAMISQVYEAYESLKKQERCLDFEDVLLLTVGMLEEDRGVRERVRDQYRYFTVDEYQDVSPLQQRLLNLWLGNREEICVVGDAAQTIYSFAGASSNFLLTFKNRFPNAQVFRLTRGYRCTPEIINAANQIVAKKLSVRETESLVKNISLDKEDKGFKVKPAKERDIVQVEEELSDLLGAQVQINLKKKVKRHGVVEQQGETIISFGSLDELNGLIERLRKNS